MQDHYWGCSIQSPHDVWTRYEIDKPLANATGGEGGIFTLNAHAGDKRVAKIYNDDSKKLLNPQAFASLAHLTSKYAELSDQNALPFVAWPIEVLFTVKHPSSVQHLQTLAGITMRHIAGHVVLEKLTTNGNGRMGLGNEKAVRIASLIASQVRRMHARNIIFCDFNPKNVLVSQNCTKVTFVDADAFQHVIIPNVFTKPHFFPGYASPDQLASKPGPRIPADDNFVLAIHIFQLLLDGGHPFDSGPAYNPTNDPFAEITPNDNIKLRRWPYSNVALYQPPGATPKYYDRLHPDLKAMFERAFGQFMPPTAEEWENLLPRFAANVEDQNYPQNPAPRPSRQSPTPHQTPLPAGKPLYAAPPQSPYPHAIPTLHPAPYPTVREALAELLRPHLQTFTRWLKNLPRRLAIAIGKWVWKQTKTAVVAIGPVTFLGFAIIALIFWGLNTYNDHLTRNQRAESSDGALLDIFFTTVTPEPKTTVAKPTKTRPPSEPEILPWLQKPAQSAPDRTTATDPPQSMSIDEANRNADAIVRERLKRRYTRPRSSRDHPGQVFN